MPSDQQERIIYVHGTDAGVASEISPHWWQPEYEFSRNLVGELGPRFQIDPPFVWSGANLESHRRRAGIELAERLWGLDAKGFSYHLIGHSHGGSVIWHALVHSASRQHRLAGLRSWTSVGTPFLHFEPIRPYLEAVSLVTFGLLIFALGPALGSILNDLESVWRNAPTAALIAAGFLFLLLLIGGAIATGVKTLLLATLWLGQRGRVAAAKQAADWYGACWLGLWHGSDEAIAGLKSSLTRPMSIAPRPDLGRASWLIRWWLRIYSRTALRAGDEYVWAMLARKAQGSDLVNFDMYSVATYPPALAPGWNSIPPQPARAIVDLANQKAATFVGDLRARLNAIAVAGDGGEAAHLLVSSLTWKEAVHTTYFDNADIRALIADRIAPDAQAARREDLVQWRQTRPDVAAGERRRDFVPLALLSMRYGMATTYWAAIAGLTFALSEAYLLPATDDRVLRGIMIAINRPEFGHAENGGYLIGEIYRKQAFVAGVTGPYELLPAAPFSDTANTLSVIRYNAYQAGLRPAAPGATERAAFNAYGIMFGMREEFVQAALPYFLFGRIDSGARPDPDMVADVWRSIQRMLSPSTGSPFASVQRPTRPPLSLVDAFVLRSLIASRAELDADLGAMAKANYNACSRNAAPAIRNADVFVRAARFGAIEGVHAIVAQCKDKKAQQLAIIDAAWAAHEAGYSDIARTLISENARRLDVSWPDDPGDEAYRLAFLLPGAIEPTVWRSVLDGLRDYLSDNPADAIRWKISLLIKRLRDSAPDLAEPFATVMVKELSQKVLDAYDLDSIEIANEIAEILATVGQGSKVAAIAAEVEKEARGPDDEIKRPARLAAAAVLYESAGDRAKGQAAVQEAWLALKPDSQYQAHRLLDLQLKLGETPPKLNAQFLDSIRNESTTRKRAARYGQVARIFAQHGYLVEAKQMADAAAETSMSLACYALIVDQYVRKHQPSAWEKMAVKRGAFATVLTECGGRDD